MESPSIFSPLTRSPTHFSTFNTPTPPPPLAPVINITGQELLNFRVPSIPDTVNREVQWDTFNTAVEVSLGKYSDCLIGHTFCKVISLLIIRSCMQSGRRKARFGTRNQHHPDKGPLMYLVYAMSGDTRGGLVFRLDNQ